MQNCTQFIDLDPCNIMATYHKDKYSKLVCMSIKWPSLTKVKLLIHRLYCCWRVWSCSTRAHDSKFYSKSHPIYWPIQQHVSIHCTHHNTTSYTIIRAYILQMTLMDLCYVNICSMNFWKLLQLLFKNVAHTQTFKNTRSLWKSYGVSFH